MDSDEPKVCRAQGAGLAALVLLPVLLVQSCRVSGLESDAREQRAEHDRYVAESRSYSNDVHNRQIEELEARIKENKDRIEAVLQYQAAQRQQVLGGPWVRIPSGYGYKLYSLDWDEDAPEEEEPEA